MGCYSASKGKDLSHFVIDNLGERNNAAQYFIELSFVLFEPLFEKQAVSEEVINIL